MTGGSGFVGKNLQEFIVKELEGEYRKASAIIIDTISTVTSSFQSLYFKAGETEYELCAPSSRQLNILDEESVYEWLGSVRFNIVLHFAVYTDAVDKNKDGSKILDYNLRSFMIFYKYRKFYGRLFYSGSGAEFDKNYDILQAKEHMLEDPDEVNGAVLNGSDTMQLVPTDAYGLMKYTCGRLIEQSENVYNVRIFGLFGKYEYRFRFITEMVLRSIEGRPFEVNQNVYFDYLWVDDFCRMLLMLVSKKNLKYHSYNLVSGERVTLRQICDMVNEAAMEYRESHLERLSEEEKTRPFTGPGFEDGRITLEQRLERLLCQPVIFKEEGLNNEYTGSNERILEELGEFEYTPLQEAIDSLYGWYAHSEYGL